METDPLGNENNGESASRKDEEPKPAIAAAAAAESSSNSPAAATTTPGDDSSAPQQHQSSSSTDKEDSDHAPNILHRILQHPYTTQIGMPVASVVWYLAWYHPAWFWRQIIDFCLRLTAWAAGVALGLGWAMHVYDQFDGMARRQHQIQQEQQQQQSSRSMMSSGNVEPSQRLSRGVSTASNGVSSSISKLSVTSPSHHHHHHHHSALLQDEQTYASLMQAAGYATRGKTLRGQVYKTDDPFWTTNYPFDRAAAAALQLRAVQGMGTLFPSLPEVVRTELGTFIEHIMRDYVASWYSLMDTTVSYQEEKARRAAQEKAAPLSSVGKPPHRRMVYQMAPHRQAPFMEKLYDCMTIMFGNLATRVEHVNVFELALLKWTKILALTFKTYRHLRRVRLQKHPEMPLTEMAVTKEFLLAGKLHKAVTFGLDVPALLFADAAGKECPVDTKNNNHNNDSVCKDENDVLEARLFDAGILAECELDYNRVVAFRMVRALLPRADFGSPLVSSLVTEIMAGCVLTPLMATFHPDYINGWFVMGLAESESTDNQESPANDIAPSDSMPDEQGVEVQVPEGRLSWEDLPREENNNNNPLLSDSRGNESSGNEAAMTCIPEDRVSGTSFDTNDLMQSSMDAAINSGGSNDLVSQLAKALIDLQDYMDLPEMKQAKLESRQGPAVDWDDHGCRAVILRLVLVLEAALMDGRCTYRVRNESHTAPSADAEDDNDMDESDRPVEVTLTQYESTTLSQLLMELTSDIEAFEERVATENTIDASSGHSNDKDEQRSLDNNGDQHSVSDVYKPTAIEQSTLRTLIAAWLHTGQVHRTMMVLMQAHATVLAPYYDRRAFLRSRPSAKDFLKVLKSLDGVDILVDTMSIMNSPRLDEMVTSEDGDLNPLLTQVPPPTHQRSNSEGAQSVDSIVINNSISLGSSFMSNSTTSRHIEFHRNEAFAASLRSERERRTQSWYSIFEGAVEEGVPIICHSFGATDEDALVHRELHQLARIFYSGTNLISIRDAARRNSTEDKATASPNSSVSSQPVSLLTVEMASQKRRIEVPDDDSSFLLRAQPRPLNAVGVHRDQRNHDQSFKCFAGTYEEPALATEHFSGGRYMRYCLIRYYPIDRTASIAIHTDPSRKVDQRKSKSTVPDTITLENSSSRQTPFLSGDFLRERHLCQRWVPRGTTRTQSILASSVMEPTDFTSQPRTGKAIEFVNRMSLFEKPMIELGGKIFTVHDAVSLGTHRADASGLEMSDAALSATLLSIGEAAAGENRQIEMGDDGYPIVWMKFSRKQDDGNIEVRPYRVSFVRAALLVTAARQEAQFQSLVSCVRAGAAKKATKALTDSRLKPTLRLIEYAGTRSREKQSLLLRDVKLGVNHIDREQLRRNGLLSPRYPTTIEELFVTVEDCFSADEVKGAELFGSSGVVYQIRVAAIVNLVADEDELDGSIGYRSDSGALATSFREEWVVYRTFKEFQTLHKHLKSQVSTSESSGTAVSRLSASLNSSSAGRRHRSALIPSLSQASKIGALGLTKKSLQKRREYLDGYLAYLFAPDHLLNRCTELLLFVGAFYPLPQEVRGGKVISGIPDPLGRTKMSRTVVRQKETRPNHVLDEVAPSSIPTPTRRASRTMSQGSVNSGDSEDEGEDAGESPRKGRRQIKMIPSIRNKIDKVPLSQVRNRIFELLRYQFGFENASFVRNRMLAAIKTASFAVTSASEFRRTLYSLHIEHLSSKAVGGWIKYGLDMLWPDGIFFESSPPLTPEELSEQARIAKEALHASFPDALRTVLGQDLTKDGLNVFHEMLQNRAVVKSLFYQLFDLLWLEVFPEIADVLQGGAALDPDV